MAWDLQTGRLFSEAQRGDRAAFDEIVLRYTSVVECRIRSEVGTLLEQRTEMDDLLQETFLRAYQSIGQFRGSTEETFQRWLATIAQHVVQDQARRLCSQKADVHREISLSQPVPISESGDGELAASLEAKGVSPSRTLRNKERIEHLNKALDTLAPLDREVIVLTRLEGLPVKDVAKRLGRTPNDTSVLLLRALLKLKAVLRRRDDLRLT